MANDAVELVIYLLKHYRVVLRASDLSRIPAQPLARFQSSHDLGDECLLMTPTRKYDAAKIQPNPTTTAPGLLYAAKLNKRDASKHVFAAVYLSNQHLFGL